MYEVQARRLGGLEKVCYSLQSRPSFVKWFLHAIQLPSMRMHSAPGCIYTAPKGMTILYRRQTRKHANVHAAGKKKRSLPLCKIVNLSTSLQGIYHSQSVRSMYPLILPVLNGVKMLSDVWRQEWTSPDMSGGGQEMENEELGDCVNDWLWTLDEKYESANGLVWEVHGHNYALPGY